jgi:hypothetical protein
VMVRILMNSSGVYTFIFRWSFVWQLTGFDDVVWKGLEASAFLWVEFQASSGKHAELEEGNSGQWSRGLKE